jgi:hypothetical protein
VHFKHGKYSRFLPSRLFATYQDAAHDPQLLELRRDIALTDARIVDLLQRVDTGESGAIWRQAQAAMAQFRRAQAQGDVEAMPRALGQVDRLLTQGHADYAAWDEVLALIEQRRKLVESEQKRVTTATEGLTVERAMTMLAQVVGIIERHVSDRGILQRIALDMQALGHHAGNGQGWHVDEACEGRQTAWRAPGATITPAPGLESPRHWRSCILRRRAISPSDQRVRCPDAG